jgi:aquaporin Z
VAALRAHWPEYLIEAAGLGTFMVVAAVMGTALGHPASPLRQAVPDPVLRRLLMGAAMGLTVIAIIYSPWGKQSGAHLNPAMTVTFLRLGKVHRQDAAFYVGAQVAGGLAGGLLAARLLGPAFGHPEVNYVATVPGPAGAGVAFLAETAIAFVLMGVVLATANSERLGRYTGLLAGTLVATYITVEAPLSGMSMNPARTLASAVPGGVWTALWVYFTAPLAGMLLAAEAHVRLRGRASVRCAKLHHLNERRCIFRCGWKEAA